jgi:hypothetical protein
LAPRGAYIANKHGRNAWVGIYGTRETGPEDIERIETDLEDLIDKSRVGVRTSIYGKITLQEVRKREILGNG